MESSKRNKFLLLLAIFAMASCSTSSYRVSNQTDSGKVELSVTPDRIQLECLWINDGDREDMYGFMIHILDNEKTVLDAIQTNVLDQESCSIRFKKISKIINEGKSIYIAGLGDINQPRSTGKHAYTFPQGTFMDNGRVLSSSCSLQTSMAPVTAHLMGMQSHAQAKSFRL